MNQRKVSITSSLAGALLWLGLAMPGLAHGTTAAQVCATLGNSCVAGIANIGADTTVTCSSTLDFVAAGFPTVNVNGGGSLELEPGTNCSLTLNVGNLLVQSGGTISASRGKASQEPGKITVNASGLITVQPGAEIVAIGGGGEPHPTIELFAVGGINIAGLVEARGTSSRGFGGHITIESTSGLVLIASSATVRAGSTDPGGTRIVIRACAGIEIAGVVDATAKKRAAEVILFSRETIRINGGDVIADVVIAEKDPGDLQRVVIEARDDISVSGGALISANSGSTNKVGGMIDVLSTQGAINCTASSILANALSGGSNGGTVSLRSFESVTPNCTVEARGNGLKGQGGTVLFQSFSQDVLGPANVNASGKIPGTIVLRACANPITNGGTYTPAAFVQPGQCVAAPVNGVSFFGGISPCPGVLPNQCPVITVVGGTVKAVQAGQNLTFNVSATDPNGGTTTLTATSLPANSSFIPNPAVGTPTATGTFSFTPTAAQANQVFNVVFTATDNQGCAGVQVIVQITVTPGPPPNQCPVITVVGGTVKAVQAGQNLTFNVSATDPNGGTTTLTATSLPANSSFIPNPAVGTPTATGTFSFTPTAAQANQVFNVVFTATDNQGCAGVQVIVQITVTPGPLVCQPPTGSSTASGVEVSLNLLPLLGAGINVSVGPIPMSMASGPPVSVDFDQLAFVSVNTLLTGNILSTGLLTTFAVVNLPTTQNSDASAEVANPDLDVVGNILLPLLGLNATVIRSEAHVGGVCGNALASLGLTTLANAVGSGALAGLTIAANPAPNTVLLDIVGVVRIILNEQIPTGNGINSRGITVNAIHIHLEAVNLTGLLGINIGLVTGDIIISHSQAQLQCACI